MLQIANFSSATVVYDDTDNEKNAVVETDPRSQGLRYRVMVYTDSESYVNRNKTYRTQEPVTSCVFFDAALKCAIDWIKE